jgi:hypothetical protein
MPDIPFDEAEESFSTDDAEKQIQRIETLLEKRSRLLPALDELEIVCQQTIAAKTPLATPEIEEGIEIEFQSIADEISTASPSSVATSNSSLSSKQILSMAAKKKTYSGLMTYSGFIIPVMSYDTSSDDSKSIGGPEKDKAESHAWITEEALSNLKLKVQAKDRSTDTNDWSNRDEYTYKPRSNFKRMFYLIMKQLEKKRVQYACIAALLILLIIIVCAIDKPSTADFNPANSSSNEIIDAPTPLKITTMPTMRPTDRSPIGSYEFKLRLDWQSGYFWQEDWAEFWWCAECTSCEEYSTTDGTDGDCSYVYPNQDNSSNCEEGHFLWMQTCKDHSRSNFEIIKNAGIGDQIRVFSTNLCLSAVFNRWIQLKTCDNTDSDQLFGPINNLDKFEIRPYDQRLLPMDQANCVSQSHHPKAEECKTIS